MRIPRHFSASTYFLAAISGVALLLLLSAAPGSNAAEGSQKSFASPEAAAQALITAAEANDAAALTLLFGPASKDVLSLGDPEQDRNYRSAFAGKAKASMKLRKDPMNANRIVIVIGEDDFPFAIPLVRQGSQWRFDTDKGKSEVLARRIGSNELDAIEICSGYVEAQLEYAAKDHGNNNVNQYAQKFVSSPGKEDGLYWPESPKAGVSPVSARITKASVEGATASPYHGYYFKILKAQGADAQGGAKDYVQGGVMIGGFGLIAWPAQYNVSGIQTFMVNQDGVVYQKDLGPGTDSAAKVITKFNPDKTWRAVR